jgi:hypothetical protein
LKDEYCETGRSATEEQMERAHELRIVLSPRCTAARKTLEQMQQTGADPSDEKQEDYRAYVEAYCPSLDSDDMWLGDWIIVRRER